MPTANDTNCSRKDGSWEVIQQTQSGNKTRVSAIVTVCQLSQYSLELHVTYCYSCFLNSHFPHKKMAAPEGTPLPGGWTASGGAVRRGAGDNNNTKDVDILAGLSCDGKFNGKPVPRRTLALAADDWQEVREACDGSFLRLRCTFQTKSEGYHYVVSCGEWCESFSLGVMASYDGLPLQLRAWVANAREPRLVSKTKIVPNRQYTVELVYQTAQGDDEGLYEIRIDGETDATGKAGDTPFPTPSSLFVGFEGLGLGSSYLDHSPRHVLDGIMTDFSLNVRPEGEFRADRTALMFVLFVLAFIC
jgi:hypothetical protein